MFNLVRVGKKYVILIIQSTFKSVPGTNQF